MPKNRKTNKSRIRNKRSNKNKSRKQAVINMVGCSQSNDKYYLNRPLKRGGAGCGPYGCPIAPLSWHQMNQYGGFPLNSVPKAESPMGNGPILGVGQNGGTCGLCQIQNGGVSQSQNGGVSQSQNGGTCGLCQIQNGGVSQIQNGGLCQSQNGGSFYKPPSLVPGPFVGSAWGAQVNKWPALDGIGGDRNYFKPYNLNKDPALQMTMNDAGYKTINSKIGGKSRATDKSRATKRRHYKRGGGLIPQDLVNLGNDMSFNLKSAYNALNGYKQPINPLPYTDQLRSSSNLQLV